MNTILQSKDLAFSIFIEDLQNEAIEKIGRELTENEINFAKKGLEWGILSSIDFIYNSIFQDIKEETL